MATQIFVNLAVKDLSKSMEFFTHLGYSFNPQFTNESGACMVISEQIYTMLLAEDFFKSFIDKDLADSSKCNEALLCLSAESREAVDDMVAKAVAAGGKALRQPVDHGWMYQWGYHDLDGHHWEIAYMDITAFPQGE